MIINANLPEANTDYISLDKGNGFIMKDSSNTSGADTYMPEVNFSTFIVSLYSSALVHLGEMPEPSTGKRVRELNIAKQTIDMVIMLEEKTRGNLDKDEEKLMANLLHELKMAYARAKGL